MSPTSDRPPMYRKKVAFLPRREILAAIDRGDVGDAEILASLKAGEMVYDWTEGTWYLFGEYHWERDQRNQAWTFLTNDVASQYLHIAAQERRKAKNGDLPAIVERLESHAFKLCLKRGIDDALSLAAKQPTLALKGDEWDSDPWLLGVANGLVDLRTGTHRAAKPGDFIRLVAPTEWRGLNAPAPRWELFQREVCSGNEEMIRFKQRLYGYSITGKTTEHLLPVLCGFGRNGKDTEVSAIGHALGPLASPVSSDVLLDTSRNPNAATPHLYALRGVRLAWVSETNDGAKLNAARVKMLTGGAPFIARPLYGKPVTIVPQYQIFLFSNYTPEADADDYALWKRMLLLNFTESFVDDPEGPHEHPRDPNVLESLKAEASGILAWLVRGCLEWQRVGLQPPESVRLATQGYQAEQDTIAQFVEETCKMDRGAEARANDLYQDYLYWCEKNHLRPVKSNAFGRRLSKLVPGFSKRRSDGVIYAGIQRKELGWLEQAERDAVLDRMQH
jgi:putative DNA primase/helicase